MLLLSITICKCVYDSFQSIIFIIFSFSFSYSLQTYLKSDAKENEWISLIKQLKFANEKLPTETTLAKATEEVSFLQNVYIFLKISTF